MHKDKIFSYQGIDNSISIYKYANNEFWLLNGRGENDPVNILNDMGIPFKVLKSVSEITPENKDRILFFAAKDLIRQLKTVNPQYKQLLFFYHTYLYFSFYLYYLNLMKWLD